MIEPIYINKTRKERTCDYCGVTIPVGSSCLKSEHKTAGKYDANDKQVGIWFHRFYNCSDRVACQRRFEVQNPHAIDDAIFYSPNNYNL